ncbi:30S ribosomal protein S16 [Candidatus Babeliales bacterium]|nr:30S ribosomal protein S16 [Candidatus Babeliales bacterium]
MAVKIRLSRLGTKNRPYWRLVAVDERVKRDGAVLDNLGTYDPIKHSVIQLHTDRIKYWTSMGALCTDAASKIIKMGVAGK